MNPIVFTALFPFCGLGAGARGFLNARVTLLGHDARFEAMGGLDFDRDACVDFEKLTGAPAWCVDVAQIAPADLRARYGARAPDVVFMSPPCKGASGLLSESKAATAKYKDMNRLALVWTQTMLAAWATPPKLVLLENVPRLKTRAKEMLRELRPLLKRAGYVFSDGFHDCGELGALAQHRRRYLLVARHASSVAPLLYQPPRRRVRACGEVLGTLPMPEDPSAGRMHRLPKISWLNWVRLSLIPAGGDWRDLAGVLADGESRRSKFKRHRVERWDSPTGTVGGSGSNGVENVADPRIALGACKPSSHHNKYRVEDWAKPAHTVIGATRPGSGAPAIADPRFGNVDRVTPWSQPVGTITHAPAPSSGGGAVADPRVKRAYDHGYAVLDWSEPSPTIAGKSHPGNGAYAVADVRVEHAYNGSYGVMSWEQAAGTITGASGVATGTFAVADPRKAPPFTPWIIAADGTWHRPLTTLELAALQGLPTVIDGAPLLLAGNSSSAWRERIGNAVPPPAAEAIALRMLVALVEAQLGAFSLSTGAVWVRPEVITS
jgi:site-specific DNA-cytosine methylase